MHTDVEDASGWSWDLEMSSTNFLSSLRVLCFWLLLYLRWCMYSSSRMSWGSVQYLNTYIYIVLHNEASHCNESGTDEGVNGRTEQLFSLSKCTTCRLLGCWTSWILYTTSLKIFTITNFPGKLKDNGIHGNVLMAPQWNEARLCFQTWEDYYFYFYHTVLFWLNNIE